MSDVINSRNALKTPGKNIPPKPLPRSHTTCLSSTSELSNAKKASAKNTPSLSSPQENKPKLDSTSVTDATSSLKRRVSFQTNPNVQGAAKDLETNSPKILKMLPIKGIFKKVLSFEEENKSYKEADSFTKIQNSSESNEKFNAEKELNLAMDELNEVLKDLGIDPV